MDPINPNPKGLRQQKRKNKLAKLPLLDASLVKKNQLEDKNEEKLILSEATCPQDELKSNKNLNLTFKSAINDAMLEQEQFARHKNSSNACFNCEQKKNPTKVFFSKIEGD